MHSWVLEKSAPGLLSAGILTVGLPSMALSRFRAPNNSGTHILSGIGQLDSVISVFGAGEGGESGLTADGS